MKLIFWPLYLALFRYFNLCTIPKLYVKGMYGDVVKYPFLWYIELYSKKNKLDVLAPEMALGPDYDRQSIRQDHFYKSEHPNILTWINGIGRPLCVRCSNSMHHYIVLYCAALLLYCNISTALYCTLLYSTLSKTMEKVLFDKLFQLDSDRCQSNCTLLCFTVHNCTKLH